MFKSIIEASVRFRWFVVLATALVAALGLFELTKLPIDAVPDITNRQVQITTVAPALAPEQIERQVTYPLETAIAGIPGFSGFFSKDEILFETFAHGHLVLWVVGALTSLLTATYMFRLVFLTFHGERRHDAPPAQFHGNNKLETILVAVPVVIVILLSVLAVKSMAALNPTPNQATKIDVLAKQFWWNFSWFTF